jgi:cold shock CspA family protein
MKIRERGVIVAYKDSKGYGFVRRADGLADIFFHVSEVDPEAVELVRPNALVEFTVTKDERDRLQACDVDVIAAA